TVPNGTDRLSVHHSFRRSSFFINQAYHLNDIRSMLDSGLFFLCALGVLCGMPFTTDSPSTGLGAG
ncbi:hypothetical protein JXQ70_02220, partial [bacterium]|nr:hypothetical protein [bacterium]